MAFLREHQIKEIEGCITSDLSSLGKLYKLKNDSFQLNKVDNENVEKYLDKGWEIFGQPLKTKTNLKKKKDHLQQFIDDIWCQFYKLGYRNLNHTKDFILPFSKNANDVKRFDILAINEDTIFLVECESRIKTSPVKFPEDKFDSLGVQLNGIKKALWQIFGRDKKIKYIYATRNLRIQSDSLILKKIEKTNSFYYNMNMLIV